ncbi:alpha-tocopherol transfer protein-like isoform X2 [Zophobas morio]|uniref:alpha-tocopherol transfer protein-like isoform X2 n=1 Tax=Zophobas morio TaxID=2755281 RepID=UPI0030835E9E
MPLKFPEAETVYQQHPELRKQDLEVLQQWLNWQPHLPQLIETQILFFLHNCYNDVERTKIAIEHYFTIRNICPEIHIALTPDVLKTTTATAFVNILPKTTPEGYAILMIKLLDARANNFNCVNNLNLVKMVSALHVHQKSFPNGNVILVDMHGFSFRHLFKMNLRAVKYSLDHLKYIRLKGIHVMNAIPLTDRFIALVKPFLNSELYNMIHCHSSNSDTLYKYVPKECLPEDYGGELPPVKILSEECLQNMLDNYEFYEWLDKQKIDESKRTVKHK